MEVQAPAVLVEKGTQERVVVDAGVEPLDPEDLLVARLERRLVAQA
jgi:hypothetical protein